MSGQFNDEASNDNKNNSIINEYGNVKISDDVVTLEARQGVAVSYHVKAG